MNKLSMTRASLLAFLLFVVSHLSAADDGDGGAARKAESKPEATTALWRENLDAALRAAADTKKPLMIDFKAEWCAPCKKLSRETFGDERVIKLLRDRFVTVKVDVDESPDLAGKYGVEALPTVLFLSSGGDEIHRLVGFRPPETFVEELGKVVASSVSFEALKQAALEAPDDVDAQRAYARALIASGQDEQALGVLERTLSKHPDNAPLELELADTHLKVGRLAKARDHYVAVSKADPEKNGKAIGAALLPLARCQLGLGEDGASLETTARYLEEFAAAEDDEDSHEARFLRGYAFSRLKRTGEAIAELEAVVEAAPDSPWGLRASYILDLVQGR